MNDYSNTTAELTAELNQTDEDILTYDVSDEALEAAAGRQMMLRPTSFCPIPIGC
jgi:hypothetical protein